MQVRSKSKHPFLSRGKAVPQFAYVVVHDGECLGRVPCHKPFGESARDYSRRTAKRGEFQVWLEGHWERASQGMKAYQPLMTIKV